MTTSFVIAIAVLLLLFIALSLLIYSMTKVTKEDKKSSAPSGSGYYSSGRSVSDIVSDIFNSDDSSNSSGGSDWGDWGDFGGVGDD